MSKYKVIGQTSQICRGKINPIGFRGPIWRYSGNPIIKRNPVEGIARVSTARWFTTGCEFIGVFRAETVATLPHLRLGRSKDGINGSSTTKKFALSTKKAKTIGRTMPTIRVW